MTIVPSISKADADVSISARTLDVPKSDNESHFYTLGSAISGVSSLSINASLSCFPSLENLLGSGLTYFKSLRSSAELIRRTSFKILDNSPALLYFERDPSYFDCGNRVKDTAFNFQVIKNPVVEELLTRAFVQEVLLRKIPKAILRQFAPSYEQYIESRCAKVFRVALSSILFSLAHVDYLEPLSMHKTKLIRTAFMGIIFSSLQESTGNTFYPIIAHVTNNFLAEKFSS